MQTLEKPRLAERMDRALLPVTVIIPTRNEAQNLPRCLESLTEFSEVYVVDSQSADETIEIARSAGAKIVQFRYQGGWPKKRQWAMDTLPLMNDWVFLLDADEAVTPDLMHEIREALPNPHIDGYYIPLRMVFLGKELRYGGAQFYKLSLFRRGKGRFECRLKDQDTSMCDMEVHEHVIVSETTARLQNCLKHENVEALSRSIRKHDEYSNWEAKVWQHGKSELKPALFGTQAERRRWLRKYFLSLPGVSILFFVYRYVFRLGFLDGIPGLIYCALQGIQFFHIKAKIYEMRRKEAKPWAI